MSGLARSIATSIDWLNRTVGRTVSWLALFMVLVQFTLVITRYVFGVSEILVQESLIYAHGTLFMLAAGYTLLVDGHVRVDIFYRGASPRKKAFADLFGVIFLLTPFCGLIWIVGLPYVEASWAVFEGSRETSGLHAVYLLKSVILAFTVLLFLQGVSLAIKSALVLAGEPPAGSPNHGAGA